MSILSDILSSLTGITSSTTETVSHPCANCESDCSVCPDACATCKPFKEKLVDALYNVANIDAFYAKYEVITSGTVAGTTKCPICGAPATKAVCEYCGSRIGEDNGKIQVTSANDIPNPIIEARDIIYARRAVVDKFSSKSDTSLSLSDLLSSVVSALTGSNQEDEDSATSLGSAMTEAEIKAMAEKYNVSVKDYLEGLDMGIYLSKTGYTNQQNAATSTGSGLNIGTAAGLGGIGTAAGILLGSNLGNNLSGNNIGILNGNRPQQPVVVPRPQVPQQQVKPQQVKPQQVHPQQTQPHQAKPQLVTPQQIISGNNRPNGNRPPVNQQNQQNRPQQVPQQTRPQQGRPQQSQPQANRPGQRPGGSGKGPGGKR